MREARSYVILNSIMNRTLVLNVTDQPLTIVSAERAIALVIKNRVDTVASNGRVFRSEKEEIHLPSIVRVRNYVNIPYKATAPNVSRKAIFARDNGECQYCGGRAENLDHVLPRSKGGKHEWTNLVAACKRCNSKKGDRPLSASGLKLRREPKEPKGSRYFHYGVPEAEWEPYFA